MTRKHDKNTEDILKDIPNGKIIINRHNSTHENTIFNKDFRYCSDGRGLVDTYSVFPGIELSFNYYYANCFEFQHRPVHSAMQINHCRSGRMGWKMQWNFPRENEYTGKYSEKMQTAKAETKAQYEEYTEQKEKEKREEIKKDVPYKGMERKNLWRLVEMVGLAML